MWVLLSFFCSDALSLWLERRATFTYWVESGRAALIFKLLVRGYWRPETFSKYYLNLIVALQNEGELSLAPVLVAESNWQLNAPRSSISANIEAPCSSTQLLALLWTCFICSTIGRTVVVACSKLSWRSIFLMLSFYVAVMQISFEFSVL
jgi:hypothetical protein